MMARRPRQRRGEVYLNYNRQYEKAVSDIRTKVNLEKEHIAKIKADSDTVKIVYPEFKDSFEYVDRIFPNSKVKEATIYRARKRLLDECGYEGVGGFYHRMFKIIVIPEKSNWSSAKGVVRAKVTDDEVIVHELLHYCSHEMGQAKGSVDVEEEFAYGWSSSYLSSKGYRDEDIVKNNFLPYLYTVFHNARNPFISAALKEMGRSRIPRNQSGQEKLGKKVHSLILEASMERGLKIIELYRRKMDERMNPQVLEETVDIQEERGGFLDLDF
tara:strand:- start:25 stop:837 length:813 start_codon:yes stop_codon:yes gene_type:complete